MDGHTAYRPPRRTLRSAITSHQALRKWRIQALNADIGRLNVSQITSWEALSSLVVVIRPSRIGDISTYLHYLMFYTIPNHIFQKHMTTSIHWHSDNSPITTKATQNLPNLTICSLDYDVLIAYSYILAVWAHFTFWVSHSCTMQSLNTKSIYCCIDACIYVWNMIWEKIMCIIIILTWWRLWDDAPRE